MSKRKDWAADQAGRMFDTVQTQGLSRAVAVNYIASELRVAHNRGAIEASAKSERRTNGAHGSAGDTGAQTADK